MAKIPETYDKVAKTFMEKAARLWASARNGGSPVDYKNARDAYSTAEKARAAADLLRNNKK